MADTLSLPSSFSVLRAEQRSMSRSRKALVESNGLLGESPVCDAASGGGKY